MAVPGAALLTVAIVGIIFGLTQSQPWGWNSPGVVVPLLASVGAAVAFVFVERRARSPLMLALVGALIAMGVDANEYISILPGLLVFGIALALVLTVNDPVTLDMVAEEEHGQASGVSATAEQFGGAMGIAGLYVAFHVAYLSRLTAGISHSSLPGFSAGEGQRFKEALLSAEQTGLSSKQFDPRFVHYLPLAQRASDHGYVVALLCVSVLAALGAVIVALLVRRPAILEPAVSTPEAAIALE